MNVYYPEYGSDECHEKDKTNTFWNETNQKWGKTWNCSKGYIGCIVPAEQEKGIGCCYNYDAFDAIIEGIKGFKECDNISDDKYVDHMKDNYIEYDQKYKCPQYRYQSDICAKLRIKALKTTTIIVTTAEELINKTNQMITASEPETESIV
jgi:hypothetical protein